MNHFCSTTSQMLTDASDTCSFLALSLLVLLFCTLLLLCSLVCAWNNSPTLPHESGHNFAQLNRINLMDSFLDGNQEWRKKMFSIRVGNKVVLMGLAMLSHWAYDREIPLFHNLIT